MANIDDVEATFRPAFQEIQKRVEASRDYVEHETTHFSRSGEPCRKEFELNDQEYVLLSMGTQVLAPRPLEATTPHLRVYGAFPSRDDAVEHSHVVHGLDASCSMIVVRRNKWILMPRTEAQRDDAELNKNLCQYKLDGYVTKRKQESDKFDEAVAQKTQCEAATTAPPVDDDETKEAEAIVYPPPPRLRAGGEVRAQSHAVACFVPDEHGECVFKVLGCFESTSAADAWVQNVASRHITDHDIYVVPTCDWISPNAPPSACQTKYRIPELQRIMDAADKNVASVQSYKEWKAEQDNISTRVDAECLEEQQKKECLKETEETTDAE